MRNYSEYLKQLNENKKLFELSISKEKIEKIERFKNSNDFKSILKIINKDKNNIINHLKKLKYDDIIIEQNNDNYTIKYNNTIYTLLKAFDSEIFISKDNNIINKIFQDGYQDLFLEIEIHKNNLNKIDILNGLPIFMKNIGLGKKIYKKLIKDFNYISSFYGYKPSIDSDMTWNSILEDKEIYSFINDNNIISFWNEMDYDIIIEKLKEFYKIQGQMFFDDDFLIEYNLTDEKLKNII